MKWKQTCVLLSCVMLLSGCSSEQLDSLNPAVNNSWGMRLSTDGLTEEVYEDSENGDEEDGNIISKGDPTAPPSIDSGQEKDAISSTLTDDLINDLNNIDASVENASKVELVNPAQIHAAAYVDKYLNPKVNEILTAMKGKEQTKRCGTLYFKVVYRGLDMTEDGSQKWVTYSKSYQNLSESSYIYSNSAATVALLSNWNSVSKIAKTAYFKAADTAVEFGNVELKSNQGSILVRDCKRGTLIKLLNDSENATEKNRYSNHYLNAITRMDGKNLFSSYSVYLNSYRSALDLSYASSAMTAKHMVELLPAFSSSYINWQTYASKENSYDSVASLTRRKISAKNLSSVFVTSKSKNTNMKQQNIQYSEYSPYSGNVYYFENGNHRLAIILYANNLWKDENKAVEQIVREALSDFKGPQNFTADELKAL